MISVSDGSKYRSERSHPSFRPRQRLLFESILSSVKLDKRNSIILRGTSRIPHVVLQAVSVSFSTCPQQHCILHNSVRTYIADSSCLCTSFSRLNMYTFAPLSVKLVCTCPSQLHHDKTSVTVAAHALNLILLATFAAQSNRVLLIQRSDWKRGPTMYSHRVSRQCKGFPCVIVRA